MQDTEIGLGTAMAVLGTILLIISGYAVTITLLIGGVIDMLRSLCCC